MGSKNKCLDAAGRKMQMSFLEFFPSPHYLFPSACIPQDCNNCSGELRERGWSELKGGKNNKNTEINHHLLMGTAFQM